MSLEELYNLWAKQYDSNDNKTRDLDIHSTIQTLDKYTFSSVLELGCGTGKNTEWLMKKADRILGIDLSEEMLKRARRKIKSNNVTFRKTDINKSWEYEKGSIDLVTASLTLEHINDLNHIFKEANGILIDNGIFFISELHPYKQYGGSKARFETKKDVVELEVFIHHISDYLSNAFQNGFELLEMDEWFDGIKDGEIPRLISFVFRKKKIDGLV